MPTVIYVRDSAISEHEDGNDRVDVFLDLIRDTIIVDLILLDIVGVGQTQGIEDANVDTRVSVLTMSTNSIPDYAVLAG